MGIQGLLPLLKDIQRPKHIREYAGKTIGIDAYVWLHRGAYGCAREIAEGKPTTKFIQYAVNRLKLLQHYGVKPYIVFDGDRLPSKAGTEEARERRRAENMAKVKAALQSGRETQDLFAKCLDITPAMAYQLIKYLRAQDVAYVVAPYEADAQLAYLEKQGIVDAVITEDSDLLVFGCKTVLFKLEGDGSLIEIRQDDFARCSTVKLHGWTINEFRQMAILSGCDYLPSIPGLGLKKAHQLLRQYRTPDRVVNHVRFQGQPYGKVPEGYLADFRRAELTFLHQRVFDPRAQKMTLLSAVPAKFESESASKDFIGAHIEDEIAVQLARGDLDPITRSAIEDICAGADVDRAVDEKDSRGPYRKNQEKQQPPPLLPGQALLTNFFASGAPVPKTLQRSKSSVEVSRPAQPVAIFKTPRRAKSSKFFGASAGSKTASPAGAPESSLGHYWGATGAWKAPAVEDKAGPSHATQIDVSSPVQDELSPQRKTRLRAGAEERIEAVGTPCSNRTSPPSSASRGFAGPKEHDGLISSPPTSPLLRKAFDECDEGACGTSSEAPTLPEQRVQMLNADMSAAATQDIESTPVLRQSESLLAKFSYKPAAAQERIRRSLEPLHDVQKREGQTLATDTRVEMVPPPPADESPRKRGLGFEVEEVSNTERTPVAKQGRAQTSTSKRTKHQHHAWAYAGGGDGGEDALRSASSIFARYRCV